MLKLLAAEYAPIREVLTSVCTSPTFKDIKKEMKEYHDVPFGSNSPTALFRRGEKTVILIWTILVITSLPIHLFLNGVTGYSIQAFPVSGQVFSSQHGEPQLSVTELNWTSLLVTDCANYLARAENWVTEFQNMTIIVRLEKDIPKYQAFVDSWNSETAETEGPPSANEIDNCYMNPITPTCSVTVRWFPLVVTTIAMIIKSVTAFLAIRKCDHFRYRLYNSLGDFIAVATRHREELSVPGECLANKGEWKRQGMYALRGGTGGIPIRASYSRKIWIRYLGFLDWLVWTFWVASVGTIWYFVSKSLDTVRNEFRQEDGSEITSIFTLFNIAGFGKVSLAFIISNTGGSVALEGAEAVGLPLQVALANCPQLWLSVGYLLWNNQITRIWGEHEWRSYAGRRKPPRVSYGAKVPGVRNTRWLQLPYVMTAMLMIVSTTMHWVVSQTMFVVEVENQSGLPVRNNVPAPDAIIFAICYSPTAIFVIAVMALAALLGITIYYFIPFQTWMPFMAGSARVVFASCCALPKDLPVDGIMWGDVSDEWGRLAGFGENAKGIQAGEIYPERFKRPAQPVPKDTATDRPTTAKTTRSYASTGDDSYFDRPYSDRQTSQDSYQRGRQYRATDLETLRYPENAVYSRPSSVSPSPSYRSKNEDLEPLNIPATYSSRNRQPSPSRSSTYTSTVTSPMPYRPSTNLTRVPSYSSRASSSPVTRRPPSHIELGAGYGRDEASLRNRYSDVSPGQERSYFESPMAIEEESDREPEWKGWGFNPNDTHESDTDRSVKEREPEPKWKGWGVNPE